MRGPGVSFCLLSDSIGDRFIFISFPTRLIFWNLSTDNVADFVKQHEAAHAQEPFRRLEVLAYTLLWVWLRQIGWPAIIPSGPRPSHGPAHPLNCLRMFDDLDHLRACSLFI